MLQVAESMYQHSPKQHHPVLFLIPAPWFAYGICMEDAGPFLSPIPGLVKIWTNPVLKVVLQQFHARFFGQKWFGSKGCAPQN